MKNYALNLHNDRWSKRLIIILFLAGIILGGLASQALSVDIRSDLGQGLVDAASLTADNKALNIAALKSNLWEILKLYLGGLCLFGCVYIPAYMFLKGFSFGFTLCFMLAENPWQDWSITLGTVIVPQLLFLPIMFLAAILMLNMSWQIFIYTKRELLGEVIRSSLIMAFLTILTVMVSLISGGITFWLVS